MFCVTEYNLAKVAQLVLGAYDGNRGFKMHPSDPYHTSLTGTYYAAKILVAIDDGTMNFDQEPISGVYERVLAHLHPDGGFGELEEEQKWVRPQPCMTHVLHALETIVLSRKNVTKTGAPNKDVAAAFRNAAAYLRACSALDGGFRSYPVSVLEDEEKYYGPSSASDTAEALAVAAMVARYDEKLVDWNRIKVARRYLSLCVSPDGNGIVQHGSADSYSLEGAEAIAELNTEFQPDAPVLLEKSRKMRAALYWVGVMSTVIGLMLFYWQQMRGRWLNKLLIRFFIIAAEMGLAAITMYVIPKMISFAAFAAGFGMFTLFIKAQGRNILHFDRNKFIWVLVFLSFAILPMMYVINHCPYLLGRSLWASLWVLWLFFICFIASFVTDSFVGSKPIMFICNSATMAWGSVMLALVISLFSPRASLLEHLALSSGELYFMVLMVPSLTFLLMQISALLGASLAADPLVERSWLKRFAKGFASAK